jgi:predicted CXXCH cytochrome family protein
MQRTKTSPDRSGGRSPRWGRDAGVGLLVLTPTMAALWLFLAAIPALADGGPHVAVINDGSLGINADSCAGCHRAHTAQGPMLINGADEEALCLTCHGAGGTGSTVDVMTGVQYTIGTGSEVRGTTVLGALRNGGFRLARIDSANAARRRFGTGLADFYAKVGVLAAGEAVTSAHLTIADDPSTVATDGNGIDMPGIAWGNGANGSGSGPSVSLGCASCHNPHGNGQYRILNPIPEATGAGFAAIAEPGQPVIDTPLGGDTDPGTPGMQYRAKNYTVIQVKGTQGNDASFLLYADQVSGVYLETQGDYFHRYVPWNPASTSSTVRGSDAPNGRPSSFNLQMLNWCTTCHTRYKSGGGERVDPITGDPDAVYHFQHQTSENVSYNTVCTTCHVAHGGNAAMTGPNTTAFPYPDDPSTTPVAITSGSSRLLKIDNRGTCQACHDPTDTTLVNDYVGPLPTPGAP